MRREDDTRQPQTETDAADTSELHLSIVLFIPGVTSHPWWSTENWLDRRGTPTPSKKHTHTISFLCLAYFHNSVWFDFLQHVYRPEGRLTSVILQLQTRPWMVCLEPRAFHWECEEFISAVCVCVYLSLLHICNIFSNIMNLLKLDGLLKKYEIWNKSYFLWNMIYFIGNKSWS